MEVSVSINKKDRKTAKVLALLLAANALAFGVAVAMSIGV